MLYVSVNFCGQLQGGVFKNDFITKTAETYSRFTTIKV